MADTRTETPIIDLNRPYVGWIDHYAAGWQVVIVRLRNGRRSAHRLGDAVSIDRATEMCHVLADATGVQFAGELSKRDEFLPVAMGGTR